MDILRKMLFADPAQRIDAETALNHPFFTQEVTEEFKPVSMKMLLQQKMQEQVMQSQKMMNVLQGHRYLVPSGKK